MDFKYKIIGLSGILILFYFQTFMWLSDSWIYDPFYSHGFLVPVISLLIVWSKRGELFVLLREKEPFGIYVFAFGLVLYVSGTLWQAFFVQAFSIIPVLIGLILYFYGKEFAKKLLFPVCFLAFMIPVPGLDLMSVYLQNFTANNAALITQNLGMGVYKTGLDIHTADCTLVIGVPCSGLRSIISLLAVAAVFTYIIKCPIQKKFIILIMSVPIAVASNTLRVASAIIIAVYFGCEAAAAFFHDFSSILLFVTAIIMLIIFAKILKCDLF